MAKDDYDVIACKILSYYYAWLKKRITFNSVVLEKITMQDNIDEVYFHHILRCLVIEGYLEGLHFTRTWDSTYILLSDLIDGSITHAGVTYLNENSTMKKAKEVIIKTGGFMADLLPRIF